MSDSRSKQDFFRELQKLNQADDTDDVFPSVDMTSNLGASVDSDDEVQRPASFSTAGPALVEPLMVVNAPDQVALQQPVRNGTSAQQHQITADTTSMIAFRGDLPRPLKSTGKTRSVRSQATLVPAQHQIFRGLIFYFFPNDDSQASVRARINKAIKYGAKWTRHLRPSMTHVVVSDGLSRSELEKFVDVASFPDSAFIVHEKFLSQCIHQSMLLDAAQYKTLIPGYETSSKRRWSIREGSPASQSSPQVRAAKSKCGAKFEITPQKSSRADSTDSAGSSPERVKQSPRQQLTCRRSIHSASNGDALDQAIQEAKKTPLYLYGSDDDDDVFEDTTATSSRLGDPDPTSSFDNPKWQSTFTCMQPPDARQAALQSPNAPVIAILQEMADYYDGTKDQWRTRAYRIAIAALKKHPKEITSAQEALELPGVGARLAAKIEEIKWTSRLRRLDNAKLDETDNAIKVFTGIYGVGLSLASHWVAQGLRTLDDLRASDIELTANQQVGLEHYDDFKQRIPRDEVTEHAAVVTKALARIDSRFQVVVGGTYRRGAASCGDIDLIITHATETIDYTRAVVIDTLVPRLTKKGFLVSALAAPERSDGTKWHGASVLPAAHPLPARPWRRLDLLLVDRREAGAALLYFTGNDVFNRSMRLLARRKGMCLNQRGLYKDVIRSTAQVKLTEGTRVAGEDERDIFRILGVPWRECTERDA